jgi:excinuclease ABC subunit A
VKRKTTKQSAKPAGKIKRESPPPPEKPLHWLVIHGARQNNLKNITVPFPLGTLSAVTGVSGSGKSSLVNEILWASLARSLHRASVQIGAHDRIEGVEYLNKVIKVDQQPIGQTPTSNPATYTGVFDQIREIFAQLPESKVRGYSARRFSFNVPGGRCEKCEGAGQLKIEMHFLPDVWITCDACGGKRYDAQTLAVQFRGKNIADVLDMTCSEAAELFGNIPYIRRTIQTLCDVGLDYITLGQSAPTLSGGEAQRVKLAAELARPDTGRTLYLLDEPTTGLHFDDLQNLLNVLHRLVDLGNTVIVIEHNLDIIKNADWIVDLGPEAGHEGGCLVFAGTPEELVETAVCRPPAAAKNGKRRPHDPPNSAVCSHTAQALLPVFENAAFADRTHEKPAAPPPAQAKLTDIPELGSDVQMPWEKDGRRWHTKDRVSRSGQPICWDGQILEMLVARIEQTKLLTVNWNSRSVVEITGPIKTAGWFLHALTSEEYLLKVKIRVPRNTFNKTALIQRLDLKPLNDIEEIPLYGIEPRVRVSQKGKFQEIELKIAGIAEIDRKEFWDFLDMSVEEFARFEEKVKPADLMPWKLLGEKWHHLPKGLIGGTKLHWDISLVKDAFDLINGIAPDLRSVMTNKVMVSFRRRKRAGRSSANTANRNLPVAVVHTKRVDALYIEIYVAKNSVTLGQIRNIGKEPFVIGSHAGYDILLFKFTEKKELKNEQFQKLLRETLVF